MPKPLSFGNIQIGLTAGGTPSSFREDDETPFHILILGDFSGRANRGFAESSEKLANRKPVPVDRDNFDDVFRKMNVALQLSLVKNDVARLALSFTELDDFHPDRLFQRVDVFQALRDLRGRLSNSSTFAVAAAEMGRPTPAPLKGEARATAPEQRPAASAPVAPGNLLEQILGGTLPPTEEARPAEEQLDLNAYLRRVVQPHLVPGADPRQAEFVAQVDEATSAQMRALLHHGDFQHIESAWRAIYLLVRRLETDVNLQVFLLDMTKEEMAADLVATENLRATGLYRLLVENTVGTPGGQPWAVVAGNFTFEQDVEDVQTLGRLARIAQQAGAPFVAAASCRIVGCESLGATPDPDDWRQPIRADDVEAWRTLRNLPAATHLGLLLPRFLLRLPYGKDSNPCEHFDFQELPDGSHHEEYLWGNPAFAAVCLLGQAFSRYGWEMRPGVIRELDGLPLYVYQEEGESRTKPCAEAVLTDRAVAMILSKSVIPVRSILNSDAVSVGRFESLSSSAGLLAGRWR